MRKSKYIDKGVHSNGLDASVNFSQSLVDQGVTEWVSQISVNWGSDSMGWSEL